MTDLGGIVENHKVVLDSYRSVSGSPQAAKLWMEWDSDWDHQANWSVLPVYISEKLARDRYGKDLDYDFVVAMLSSVWTKLWLLLMKHFAPENLALVAFSKLGPNQELKPHKHENPGHLIFHMGIDIPKGDIGIQTSYGKHAWENPTDWVLFDDNATHSAWNRTDRDRVVFYIDFIPSISLP